ncbi:TPA: hypothetical protein KE579_001301 [Citrobacter braakii]|nr:hypothetical protein [Citrobacter braakii]
MSAFLNNLYSTNFVKSSRELRRMKSYNGVKVSLEMVLTYDLIASYNRDQKMTNGFTKEGKPSEFGQAELSDYLMCSVRTAATVIANLKKARMIECVGRGANDVDMLVCLPIEAESTEEATPAPKPGLTRQARSKPAQERPEPQPTPATPLPIQPTTTEEAHNEQRADQPGITECGYSPDLRNSTSECEHVDVVHSGYGVCTSDTDRGLTLEEIDLSTIPAYDLDPVDADQYGDAF